MGLKLSSQGNLRHQNQHITATGKAYSSSLQIDLGLTTAGHTMEQECCKFLFLNGWNQYRKSLILLRSKDTRLGKPGELFTIRVAENPLFNQGHKTLFQKKWQGLGCTTVDLVHLTRRNSSMWLASS